MRIIDWKVDKRGGSCIVRKVATDVPSSESGFEFGAGFAAEVLEDHETGGYEWKVLGYHPQTDKWVEARGGIPPGTLYGLFVAVVLAERALYEAIANSLEHAAAWLREDVIPTIGEA